MPVQTPASLDRALREEQFQVARQLYEDFPQSDAAFVLGVVCQEQGDTDAAIRYWEEAIRLGPGTVRLHDRAETLSNLGEAYKVKENYAQAEALFRESLQLNPRRQETYYRLAQLLYVQNKLEECVGVLDEGKVKSSRGYALRAQADQRLGKLVEARQNYELAIQFDPKLVEAYYGLAMICARLGEMEKSKAYQRKFAELKKEQQSHGRQTRLEYNPVADARRSLASTHTQAGWVYQAHGKPQQAEKLWLRAAEVDPNGTACRFQLVMLYQKAQRNQEALRWCLEMTRAEPNNAFHYLGLGNLYARLKQPAEALAAYKKTVELAPNRAEGPFALAQFYLQTNTNLAEALLLAQRAVQLAPVAPHYFGLSQAWAKQGNLPAARQAIDKACELNPRSLRFQEFRKMLPRE